MSNTFSESLNNRFSSAYIFFEDTFNAAGFGPFGSHNESKLNGICVNERNLRGKKERKNREIDKGTVDEGSHLYRKLEKTERVN